MKRLAVAALATANLVTLAFACNPAQEAGSQQSDITEWATAKERDKAYSTKYVIEAACAEIYGVGAQAQTCRDTHEFKLVQSKYSTKYGYLKAIEDDIAAPIEVGQLLEVTAPGGGVWEVELLRQLDRHYHLRWSVVDVKGQNGGAPPVDVHDHIEGVAEDLGEYPDFGDSEDVQSTTWAALPSHIQLECEAVMLARAEMNSEDHGGGQCVGSADWHGDFPFGEITLHDEVVGYVCGIQDELDNCPQWDGSGVYLYLDANGEIIVETDFSA